MDFLTRKTKTQSITASVLTGIMLITLIMLSTLLNISLNSKTILCFSYTISLMFILLIWQGLLQIKVFKDYKYQNKMLCTDGIISLCLSALLIICSGLFCVFQLGNLTNITYLSDIRIFIASFIFLFFIWKTIVTTISYKQKRYNWWCELLFAFLWLILDIICIISIFTKSLTLIAWLCIVISWLLIIVTIFYTLYSYIFKSPDYLKNDKAIEIYNKEKQDEQDRKNRLFGKTTQINSSKIKLIELKDMFNEKLITEEEYKQKKQEILNKE